MKKRILARIRMYLRSKNETNCALGRKLLQQFSEVETKRRIESYEKTKFFLNDKIDFYCDLSDQLIKN